MRLRPSPPVLTWLILLGLTLAWDASGWDVEVMQHIGTAQGFAGRHDPWLEGVLHDGLRRVLSWVLAVATLWALWTVRQRPGRLLGVGLVWLSLLVVNVIKHLSQTSCPWDWQAFGGVAQPISHWAWGVLDGGSGGCFPGGHASSGFAFLALAWPASRPRFLRPAVWTPSVLSLSLGIGLLAGAVQTLRGAHPPSHTLWTLLICSGVALLLGLARSPAETDAQRQVHEHADDDGAEHAALPEEPGHAGRSGVQTGVLPGVQQHALAHHDLGHDHR